MYPFFNMEKKKKTNWSKSSSTKFQLNVPSLLYTWPGTSQCSRPRLRSLGLSNLWALTLTCTLRSNFPQHFDTRLTILGGPQQSREWCFNLLETNCATNTFREHTAHDNTVRPRAGASGGTCWASPLQVKVRWLKTGQRK